MELPARVGHFSGTGDSLANTQAWFAVVNLTETLIHSRISQPCLPSGVSWQVLPPRHEWQSIKLSKKKVKEAGLQTLCRVVVLKGGPQSSSISITWELKKNEVIGPHLRPPMLETLGKNSSFWISTSPPGDFNVLKLEIHGIRKGL